MQPLLIQHFTSCLNFTTFTNIRDKHGLTAKVSTYPGKEKQLTLRVSKQVTY